MRRRIDTVLNFQTFFPGANLPSQKMPCLRDLDGLLNSSFENVNSKMFSLRQKSIFFLYVSYLKLYTDTLLFIKFSILSIFVHGN